MVFQMLLTLSINDEFTDSLLMGKQMRICLMVLMTVVSLSYSATITSYGLGNSLMDEFDGIPTLAASKGDVCNHGRYTIPGCGMKCLWDLIPGLPPGFSSKRLDCVLTEAFCNGDELNIDGDSKYMGYYYDASLAVNPNCRLLVFTQWMSKDWGSWSVWETLWHSTTQDLCPKYGTAAYHEGLVLKLRAMYPSKEVSLLPIGHVMDLFEHEAAAGRIPGYSGAFGLFADGIHLNTDGKYLQNLTAYAVMFKKDPHGAGLSFAQWSGTETVTQAFANIAADLVWKTVTDLSTLTNVGSSTPGKTIIARIVADKASGAAPLTVAFDGSGSTGTNLSYAWKFGDGQTGIGSKVNHMYQTAGSYKAVLTATGGAEKDSAQTTITVSIPVEAYKISKTSNMPLMDGSESTQWQTAPAQPLTHALTGAPTNAADLSVQFRTMWDATNLYVLVKVTDDIASNSASMTYQNDGIEVYVDGDNSKGSSYDANDIQYRIVRGKTSLETSGTDKATGVVVTQKEIAGGYTAAFTIPWTTIGTTASVSKMIGMEVHAFDNDGTASRKTVLSWAGTTDDAWATPSVFGTAQLVETGATTIRNAHTRSSGIINTVQGEMVKMVDIRGRSIRQNDNSSSVIVIQLTSKNKAAIPRVVVSKNSRRVW